MNLTHSKKGQLNNVLMMVVVALFVMGFMSILAYLLLSNIITAYQATGLYDTDMAKTGTNFLNAILILDKLIVLIMVTLIIGIGITSYRLSAPPFFFVVMLITGILYGFIAYFFNYVFQEISTQAVFSAVIGLFPVTIFVCRNLQWVMLLEIIVASITLFGKKPKGQYMEEEALSGKYQ
jgi:F0F1-type ATP synthase assembly protein I